MFGNAFKNIISEVKKAVETSEKNKQPSQNLREKNPQVIDTTKNPFRGSFTAIPNNSQGANASNMGGNFGRMAPIIANAVKLSGVKGLSNRSYLTPGNMKKGGMTKTTKMSTYQKSKKASSW